MADPNPPEDTLSNLRRRIDAARGEGDASKARPPQSAASLAVRFGGEFGAAVLVGVLIGIGIDQVMPTSPWGLVVGLGLGFAAGVVNMARVAREYSKANPVDPNAPRAPDEEED